MVYLSYGEQDMECAAVLQRAFGPDRALVQFDKTLAHRQP
jgi:hypothetical protein